MMNKLNDMMQSSYRDYLLDMLLQLVPIAREAGESRIAEQLEEIVAEATVKQKVN